MPDAGRTRGPRATKSTGVGPQVQPGHPAFPARWLYGLWRALPGDRALIASVALRASPARLDSSVGESGPHAFAVREKAFVGAQTRAEPPCGHRIPLPTSVTIAIRPSWWRRDGAEDNHNFRKNGREIFFEEGLDAISE